MDTVLLQAVRTKQPLLFWRTKSTSKCARSTKPSTNQKARINLMKKMPRFKSEDQEREFWATRDSTEFVDWKKAKRTVLANLKPSVKTISLRIPESMLEELKLLANKQDVPYQSLLKMFLAERIQRELRAR